MRFDLNRLRHILHTWFWETKKATGGNAAKASKPSPAPKKQNIIGILLLACALILLLGILTTLSMLNDPNTTGLAEEVAIKSFLAVAEEYGFTFPDYADGKDE